MARSVKAPEKLTFKTLRRISIPAIGAPDRLRLSALDNAMSGGLLEVLYFYDRELDPGPLEQSLRRTLRYFPMLCGQLRAEPDGSLSVGQPHPGALFSVRECNLPLATVTAGIHTTHTAYDFFERIQPLTLRLRGRPLATFTLTRFKGGGCALSISIAHAVVDAYSFYYFIRCWSQVHSGLPCSPWHDRDAFDPGRYEAAGHPSVVPKSIRGFRRLSLLQLLRLAGSFAVQQGSMACRVLRFTRPQLEAIRNDAAHGGPVSLHDALSAHLWQFFTRLQHPGGRSAQRRLLVPVDMRPRAGHPRAREYFGNAIVNTVAMSSTGELADARIADIAGLCRRQVAACDAGYVTEQLRWLAAQQKTGSMLGLIADVNPFAGDCMVSNLSRLPVHDAQFDGCRPVRAEVPVIPIPWVMQVFSGPGDSGDILVSAHIPRAAADALATDAWQAELYKYGEAAAAEAGDKMLRNCQGARVK